MSHALDVGIPVMDRSLPELLFASRIFLWKSQNRRKLRRSLPLRGAMNLKYVVNRVLKPMPKSCGAVDGTLSLSNGRVGDVVTICPSLGSCQSSVSWEGSNQSALATAARFSTRGCTSFWKKVMRMLRTL